MSEFPKPCFSDDIYLYETKEGTLQQYLNCAPINYTQYEALVKQVKNSLHHQIQIQFHN